MDRALLDTEAIESYKILLECTRSLLRSSSPEEVVGILIRAVRMAGGRVVPASEALPSTTPLDISLGLGSPLLADLPDRGFLARSFPRLVEDARWMLHRLQHLERVEEDAVIDPLTGLLNRRALERLVPRLRSEDVVVMLDLDHFKRLNDTEGHAAGDRLLREFSRCLRTCLRQEDGIGRFGGEEFLVLMRSTPITEAVRVLERLRIEWFAMRPYPLTFSGGIAEVGGSDPRNALHRADVALYEAKEAGRDTVRTAA